MITPEARCIWLTEEDAEWIAYLLMRRDLTGGQREWLEGLKVRRDAAPADPVAALAPVIARHGPYAPAWRLLEALGYPDGSPRQETPT